MLEDFEFVDIEKARELSAYLGDLNESITNQANESQREKAASMLLEACGNDFAKIREFKKDLQSYFTPAREMLDDEIYRGVSDRISTTQDTAQDEAELIITGFSEAFALNALNATINKHIENHEKEKEIEEKAENKAFGLFESFIDLIEACDALKSLSQKQLLDLAKEFGLKDVLPKQPDDKMNPYDVAKAALRLSIDKERGKAFENAVKEMVAENEAGRGV